jgi:hypothetical protein
MAIFDIFNVSFLFSIGIIVILIGGIFTYVSYRMSEQDHKLSSMLGLVVSLANDLQQVKDTNRPVKLDENMDIQYASDMMGGQSINNIINVSDGGYDDEDENEEYDDLEGEETDDDLEVEDLEGDDLEGEDLEGEDLEGDDLEGDDLEVEDLQNLDEFSPKMGCIMRNIEKHNTQLGIIYSQFVSGEGIAIFARVLESLGYNRYGSTRGSSEDDFGLKKKSYNTFAVLSGDISPEERLSIINTFKSTNNIDGSVIQLLLLSGAVAEGIDLKRIRHVHVMEPFWNYARINQVKTRAIRYMSHQDLPVEQQNVQVYIYLSDYPLNHPTKKITEPTTDNDLYDKSINNMQIINTFLLAIAESSMDCSMHYPKLDDIVKEKLKCKLCSPDNTMLYHPILKKDMALPSACRPYSEQKIKVSEIVLPGTKEKFYYKKDNDSKDNTDIKLYHFNTKLNGYAPVLRTHPLYGDLMSAIILEKTQE